MLPDSMVYLFHRLEVLVIRIYSNISERIHKIFIRVDSQYKKGRQNNKVSQIDDKSDYSNT